LGVKRYHLCRGPKALPSAAPLQDCHGSCGQFWQQFTSSWWMCAGLDWIH
jgi:hypothetical protein